MTSAQRPDEARERRRMVDENARRRHHADDRYAPWNPAERLMVDERRRVAATLLHVAGVFPDDATPCLEVGFGDGGWLPELLAWGVAESHLHGAEVDPSRAAGLHRRLPSARLLVTGGASLPWRDRSFGLIIASTVFSSILDDSVRQALADEIVRVLRTDGAVVWYDFAIDNPRNRQVRGMRDRDVRALFPDLDGTIRRVTLAPPLARRIAPWSVTAATCLSALPWLRTHRLAVLRKRPLTR
ncbi:MAG: class I SAM-dependent methyltransferase [Acidobacteriota bacterium]